MASPLRSPKAIPWHVHLRDPNELPIDQLHGIHNEMLPCNSMECQVVNTKWIPHNSIPWNSQWAFPNAIPWNDHWVIPMELHINQLNVIPYEDSQCKYMECQLWHPNKLPITKANGLPYELFPMHFHGLPIGISFWATHRTGQWHPHWEVPKQFHGMSIWEIPMNYP